MLGRLRQLRSNSLAFLIVLLGFQSSPAFTGLNLCIGVDGHLEIGTEADDCCPSQSPLASENLLVQEEGACTACIDVSLGGQAANTLATPTGNSNEFHFPAASLLERLNPLQIATDTPDRGFPAVSFQLAVRSVVLRV